MTYKRKISLIILVLGGLFIIFAFWYKYQYSMDIAEAFEVNSPDQNPRLLIATQGSDYKDKVTQGVVNYFEKDSIYIKGIDATTLTNINPTDYDAILIIHTWENWRPPKAVELFINRNKAVKDKIVVLTTSGEGTFKMEDVDAITGESKLENATTQINEIIKRLKPLLNQHAN